MVPEYLGALKSLLLNEDATLFRRKYYVNGAHAGYLLFTSGGDLEDEDITAIKDTVAETKGIGNFRSFYIHMDDSEGKVYYDVKPVGGAAGPGIRGTDAG